jgi:hypothetical protein
MPVFTAIATITAIVGGIAAGGVAGGIAAIGAAGVGAMAATGAVVGAVIGGGIAAVKGENILKGALKGGLIGAAAGGVLGWGAQALVAKGLVGAEAAAAGTAGEVAGAGAGAGMTETAALEAFHVAPTVAGESAKGGLSAFWGGLSGSDKTLLLASGAEMVGGAMGPDEEELLERKAELEREAMKISGIGEIEDFRAKIDWKKFEKPQFERTATNRFNEFNKSFTPELFTSDAGPSDANLYRTPGTAPAPSGPSQPSPTGTAQPSAPASAPSGTTPTPKPQSMLGK